MNSSIFFNNFGRIRGGWRFAVYFGLVFFIVLFLALSAGLAVSQETLQFLIEEYPQQAFFLNGMVLSVISIAAAWLCLRNLENLPFRALGLSFTGNWLKDLSIGSLLGVLTLFLAAFIGFFLNGLTFEFNQRVSFSVVLQNLLLTFLIFLAGATWEEVAFRGYPLQTLFRAGYGWFGILLTSLLFGLIHTDNPNVSSSFTLINTTLAGFWFGIAYLKTRNLWFPLGLHWAWNWALSSIAGLPVSGITTISPQPIFIGIDAGPTWLTGGHYGIEGGIACTVALVVSTILIWFAPFLKADEELLAMTTRENPATVYQTAVTTIKLNEDKDENQIS